MNKNMFCISKRFIFFSFLIISIFLLIIISTTSLKKPNTIATKAVTNQSLSNLRHLSTNMFNIKVLSVYYNPFIDSSQNLKVSDIQKWNNPTILNQQIIDFFKEISNNRINYQIVKSIEKSTFPIKEGNTQFSYNDLYKCLQSNENSSQEEKNNNQEFQNTCLKLIDYQKMIKDLDICQKVNNGEIDEVWLWGGPFFGFNESAIIGPNAFPYNGKFLTDTTCNKLVPIMGFNYEREVDSAIHDFGHRMEATMTKVYSGQSQNFVKTRWDKFSLVKGFSPQYSYGGCGTIHYPPFINGEMSDKKLEYNYDTNQKGLSDCDQFIDYSTVTSQDIIKKDGPLINIDCKIMPWKCSQLGYLKWWFSHLPNFSGIGFDGVLNDWITYMIDPKKVYEYPVKESEKTCIDYTISARNSGLIECLNKKYNSNSCKWYEYCQQCSNPETTIGETCGDFCSQFDNNIIGCQKAQDLKYGCAWHSPSNKCVKISSDQSVIIPTASTTKPAAKNSFDIYITLNDPSNIYINKVINLEIYEVLPDEAIGKKLVTKTVTTQAYKDIPYRLNLDQIDSISLDPTKKYYIKPVLLTNDKNPVYYTVSCPNEYLPKCFISPSKVINFTINMSAVSCYNIPEQKFCNIPQCVWSGKNACYKVEDKTASGSSVDSINLKNYCSNIKTSEICSKNNICIWNNKCQYNNLYLPSFLTDTKYDSLWKACSQFKSSNECDQKGKPIGCGYLMKCNNCIPWDQAVGIDYSDCFYIQEKIRRVSRSVAPYPVFTSSILNPTTTPIPNPTVIKQLITAAPTP